MATPATTATPDIRIIPSLVYKGVSSDLSTKEYINYFSSYASGCGWDTATSKLRLLFHIQGSGYPLEWKTEHNAWIMATTTRWDMLIDRFVKELNPRLGYYEDITLFTRATQTVLESLMAYLERMKLLFKKVDGLTEAQAVNIMMDNVHPYYRPSIQAYDCSTFKDAETIFRKVERYCNRNVQP
jgi:hypothetical protein